MKSLSLSRILGVSSVLIGTISLGCAMPSDQARKECGTDYSCLSDMAFKYRQQANRMSELAQRYELEATAMTGEDAKQQHQRAQVYWSEAQQADQLAQDYRRQIPHNMTAD